MEFHSVIGLIRQSERFGQSNNEFCKKKNILLSEVHKMESIKTVQIFEYQIK